MLASRENKNAVAPVGGKPLVLAALAPAGKKPPGGGGRPHRRGATGGPLSLVGLVAALLASSATGGYALLQMRSLDRTLRGTREQLERRVQQLDAGVSFESRRQRLLLGIRDAIMEANRRLGPEVAYEYATHLVAACERYPAVDPVLLLAMGVVESRYDERATSAARARGIYQITPATGRMLARMLDWQYTDEMLHDAGKNTLLAALYLDVLLTAYNDETLVLAEYNGGPLNAGYLRAGSGKASAETRSYVAKVLELRERLKEKLDQGAGASPTRSRTESPREARRLGEGRGIRQAAAIP